MWQTRTNKVVLVEYSDMLDEFIKLSQQPVLNELCLQEASFVNRTVEESLEADIPEEIGAVFLSEEILSEVAGVVSQLLGHDAKGVGFRVGGYKVCEGAVEQLHVIVVLL
jgi:hypothetical protein